MVLTVVVLAAVGLHALLLALDRAPAPRRLWGDEIMYADLAERAARAEPAEIELLWPPLYPRLLGLAARAGPLLSEPPGVPPGSTPLREVGRARAVVVTVQLALLALAALSLRVVAWRLTGSVLVADVAAALFLLDPQLAAFAHYLWPETLHLALFLGVLALLTRPRCEPAACVCAGLLLGVALLTKSLLQPFVPILVAPVVGRSGLRRAGAVVALAALVIAPTVLSNGRRHGAYTVADSALFNLWVGLNDRAPRNFQDEIVGRELLRWRVSATTFGERNTLLAGRVEALVRERGLARLLGDQFGRQYYRLFGAPSFLDDQLPGGAIAAHGFGYIDPPAWAARLLAAWSVAHYGLLLAAAAFGVWLLPWRRRDAQSRADRGDGAIDNGRAWLLVAAVFIAYNLVLLLFLHVKTRYRVPLMPFFHLAAAVALVRLAAPLALARVDAAALPRPGRRALAAGALLAALLLKLAFWPPSG
jgi:hypothetical protein